jgi:hypothetical protein
MKKTIILIFGALFGLTTLQAEVNLTFENPENFRDIEYGDGQVQRGLKVYLPVLEKHILKQAKRFMKEGQSLSMTVTDIDLAGEYEPWRSINFQDIRIVKSIYPPRMAFSFELTDKDGEVIKSGDVHLIDMQFEYRVRFSNSDELFYEKEMITDWFRSLNSRSK